ncbi:hypothetical protein G5S37_09250 [Roseimicrobium sp. ORNL1]|nr:hypothetical protein G5S37_09250 [Roseimicrobium sp. ORNL1]
MPRSPSCHQCPLRSQSPRQRRCCRSRRSPSCRHP